MADELFELRNTVALGNFHQAIAEGSQIKASGRKPEEIVDIHAERDLLIARARVALGQADSVVAEYKNASHPLLKAAFAWASFHKALLSGDSDTVSSQLHALEALAGDKPTVGVPATAAAMLAGCYFYLDDLNKGLHLCGSWVEALNKQIPKDAAPSNLLVRHILELRGICVEGLLRLSRVDLAERMLQEMRTLDDDAVVTMLAGVSVVVSQAAAAPSNAAGNSLDGSNKVAEALSLIQDLGARCGQTATLYNIAAIASMLAGKTGDAEKALIASLGKRSTDVDTLSNLAALAATLSKPQDSFHRLCRDAIASNSEAAWTKQYAAAQQRFRDAASAFVAQA
jgi:coatomer protein complex subunit epsilon